MMERTTVRLPSELLEKAKRKAAAEGRTLTALIEDGLRLIVTEKGKASERKRIMPRVSAATGGLMPGIDLTDSAALQEAEDIDYMRRMTYFR